MKNQKVVKPAKEKKNYNVHAKMVGILELFVLVSICYSTFVVYMGVEDTIAKLMLVPQVLFVAVTLTKRFTK